MDVYFFSLGIILLEAQKRETNQEVKKQLIELAKNISNDDNL